MKGEGTEVRLFKALFFFGFLILFLAGTAPTHADDGSFLLKPDARMKVCLGCHTELADKMKDTYVHSVLKQGGDCTVCHNPHTSDHGKLLSSSVKKLCFKCHADRIPANAKSTHKPVNEGKCTLCHDPHASNNPFHLLKAGNEVCFQCHKNKEKEVSTVKYKHWPVDKGCTNCHSPHGSATADFLLKKPVPDLCLGCHKLNDPEVAKQHDNYPMQNANCTLCHNPHGSNQPGILYDNVHPPMAARMCGQCHQGTGSANPFKLKEVGYKLCQKCHATMVKGIMAKDRVHWPLLSKKGCVTCHSPHASPQKFMLKAPMKVLCGKCHPDTIARQERSKTKHKPVLDGQCAACHDAHSSNYAFLINQPAVANQPANKPMDWPTVVDNLCGTCHNYQLHSTHPVGPKVVDLRNKNTRVQCLSCHRVHGTSNKYMLHFWPITTMCVQCHKEYRR